MKTNDITAIVLTYNEERHLRRCLKSLSEIGATTVVVDSFSTDETLAIAQRHGVAVLQHQFLNHASQFNWALEQIGSGAGWVLRLDADEYLTPRLIAEINHGLPGIPESVAGVYCGRRMTFQGRLIRYGGISPIRVLRLFRAGRGRCENRWMDEHVKAAGETADFQGEIIDDNLQPLTWWVAKHNNYASREAVDLLNIKYGFMPYDSVAGLAGAFQAGVKRWIKEKVYARLPGGFRAFAYFSYRYFLRLGFLDGTAGTTFHVLQGFWYRYLVDAKIAEVERYMAHHGCGPDRAITEVLGIVITPARDGEAVQP